MSARVSGCSPATEIRIGDPWPVGGRERESGRKDREANQQLEEIRRWEGNDFGAVYAILGVYYFHTKWSVKVARKRISWAYRFMIVEDKKQKICGRKIACFFPMGLRDDGRTLDWRDWSWGKCGTKSWNPNRLQTPDGWCRNSMLGDFDQNIVLNFKHILKWMWLLIYEL